MNLCVPKAIEKESDQVWIDGQCYTVTRLPSSVFTEDMPFKSAKDKDPYEKLRQQAPQQQRKNVIKLLTKEKLDAFREKSGLKKITSSIKSQYAEELTVTEEEISRKIWELNS